ncbi:MAG: tyrosine-type recombinase/integrase [Planctomycetes bacterium]|nr:tyrosine-type recombinase/integrase [Planctomycetota bacterium]
MPKTKRFPKYRLHKPSGQAVVDLNGESFYLGRHGTEHSKAKYDRLIAEWLANGRKVPNRIEGEPERLICELIAAYWDHAQVYYRKNGRPTTEQSNIHVTLKRFNRLYGKTLVSEFGPLALKGFRQSLIDEDRTQTCIKRHVGHITRMFRWGVENEMVPGSVLQDLQAVAGLRKGRSAARETEPVKPVDEEYVKAVEPFVSRPVWAMIRLQRLTGMRPGEARIVRACDIAMDGDIWEYRPHEYKTEHHDIERVIPLGLDAQAIVREFLKTDTEAYLFSPADAEAERRAKLHAERTTPLKYGNWPGSNRKATPSREAGEQYTTDSYRRAIERGCKLAFPAPDGLDEEQTKQWHKEHRWHPNQLRHTSGTKVRKQFGLEAAQVHLGHAKANTTEIYAERNLELAREIARQIG